ncbi:MAG TPA: class I SAM-dependent methyltransferase [Steroidobacteraceae bacterium]|nr:class I SAM-dependent methyltransferase [Steroidobacteraceae bacterium]
MAGFSDSYTATHLGFVGRIKEALLLYRTHAADTQAKVAAHLRGMDDTRASIEAALGEPLVGKTMLEIGPGQLLGQARYFAADNTVVGIDLDEVLTSFNPIAMIRTLRVNGPVRFAKTLVRKLAGFDRQFLREMVRQRPSLKGSHPRVLREDATNTSLPSASFDCATSVSVFEHLPDPGGVLREIRRLLRPGGVSHHLIHLYTSDSGAHDARTYLADRSGFPYWCHLRPAVQHLLAPNCYVNRLSLTDWTALIEKECPGAQVQQFRAQSPYPEELAKLRTAGELAEYSDAELLTLVLMVIWKKPSEGPK